VLRLEVFDPAAQEMKHLRRKVVAEAGVWSGIIPFAVDDDLVGATLRFTDVATGTQTEYTMLPALTASHPAHEHTLPREKNNEIKLVFSDVISDPGSTPLVITEIDGGADVSSDFDYSFDGNTLYALENGVTVARLSDRTWYRVKPATALAVQDFTADLCTLRGDADDAGHPSQQVLSFDYFEVKNNMFYSPGHMSDDCSTTPPQTVNCGRADLDGSGQVLSFDYFVVKNNMFHSKPTKP
jgi:hypothetical protein